MVIVTILVTGFFFFWSFPFQIVFLIKSALICNFFLWGEKRGGGEDNLEQD